MTQPIRAVEMIECDDWLQDKGRVCGRPAVNRIVLSPEPVTNGWYAEPTQAGEATILHKCARHTRRYAAGIPGYQIEIQTEEDTTP